MFCDIVFPKGNERKFIETAEKLGIEGLAFSYGFQDKATIATATEKVKQLQQNTKIKLAAVFKAESNKIYKIHDNKEIAIADGSGNSRDVIGRLQPDIVYDLEGSRNKDFAKTRDSGLDKAICQLARKNNVIAAFSLSTLLNSEDIPKLLGRVMQNIKFCKKYKVKTALASFAANPEEMRAPQDLRALLLSLGAHTFTAKKAIEEVAERLNL